MLGDSNTLVASFFWGTIGTGFAIFGWKQKSMVPLFGGIAMIAVSYFIGSALWMSVVEIGLIVVVYWLRGRF
ncbi:MAG: hypothetical protein QOD03_251 [Verrucomicrobiota bacterium]